MSVFEETVEAMLDANGQLQLLQQPRLPPGRVQVTIRALTTSATRRGLADVIREIAAEQRIRGFLGRSAAELQTQDQAQIAEEGARDQELLAASRWTSSGSP